MDLAATMVGGIGQITEISQVILFSGETWLTIIATLNDMLWNSRQIQARKPSHGISTKNGDTSTLTEKTAAICQQKDPILVRKILQDSWGKWLQRSAKPPASVRS
jgi:hypothetical protein